MARDRKEGFDKRHDPREFHLPFRGQAHPRNSEITHHVISNTREDLVHDLKNPDDLRTPPEYGHPIFPSARSTMGRGGLVWNGGLGLPDQFPNLKGYNLFLEDKFSEREAEWIREAREEIARQQKHLAERDRALKARLDQIEAPKTDNLSLLSLRVLGLVEDNSKEPKTKE